MRRRGRIAPDVKPNGIVSNCDVCGGLMFNAQRKALELMAIVEEKCPR